MIAKTAAVLAIGSAAAFAPGAVLHRAPSIRASVAPLRVVANSEPGRRQFLANVGAFAVGAAISTTNLHALALSPPENNGVVPGSEDDPYSSKSIMKQVQLLKPNMKPAARNFEIQRIVRRANVRRIRGSYEQLLKVQSAMKQGDEKTIENFFQNPGDAAVAMGLYLEDLKKAGMPQDADFFQKFEPVAKQYGMDFNSFQTAVKSRKMEEAADALMELRATLLAIEFEDDGVRK